MDADTAAQGAPHNSPLTNILRPMDSQRLSTTLIVLYVHRQLLNLSGACSLGSPVIHPSSGQGTREWLR